MRHMCRRCGAVFIVDERQPPITSARDHVLDAHRGEEDLGDIEFVALDQPAWMLEPLADLDGAANDPS